jgi:glycosyltransferase involved in cell wall biosynthesis
MKIIQFIVTIDNSFGGPARSVTHLIQSILDLKKQNEIELITTKSKDPIVNDFEDELGTIVFLEQGFMGTAKRMKYHLKDIQNVLYHGHGIWDLPIHQMVKQAISNKIPYIISTRGMVDPTSLDKKRIKKNIALKVYQYKDLKKANCLHATAFAEVKNIRSLGLRNPIAMIPNGVNISEFPDALPEKENKPKKILYLSRIHPQKGIGNLIEAWSLLNDKIKSNWIIEIVGNGDEKYISELNGIIHKLNLSDQIFIKTPVYNTEKINIFRSANLFVLPTYSESFGIVIAEALASYTPVITTVGAPWEELKTANCGWWINIGVEPLKKALESAMQTDEIELVQMGIRGRKLIESKYSMESVAKQMMELYSWVLTNKNKPSFVNEL